MTTGIPIALEPLVTRILAPNASAYTYTGTQSYLVGSGDVAVIDPGPDDPAHLDALIAAIGGRPVRAILVTHHHRDHSPATRPLAQATGAPIVGAAPFARGEGDPAFDREYAPDRVLADGESVAGDGWTLTAVATPGHTSNHLCFALPESGALFSGDHVMGWSTSIVSPPDGDMGAYMASLEKLLAREDRVYYPGHGDAVERPRRLVRSMLGHRRLREGQILRLLEGAPSPVSATGVSAMGGPAMGVPAMVERMYVGVDPRLRPAAERSVLAHLLDLRARGLVAQDGPAWRIAA